jgi:hypothetical protein
VTDDEARPPDLRKAAAERAAAAVLPACGIAWTSAEIMHWLAWPGGLELAGATAVAASLAYGASGRWRKVPAWTAWAIAGAGGWLSLAAAEGPLAGWPYAPLTWAWLAASLWAWRRARRHPAVLEAQEWRAQRAEWLEKSPRWGLRGTHLLEFKRTLLGERYVVDTRGTRKRASQIAASGVAELIAEHENLPVSRVDVARHRLAGRVSISVRYTDPWAKPAFHPVLLPDQEITLPVPCSIRDLAAVGHDPETARPLTVPLWDETGGKNISVVAIKGSGKTVLLDDISERVTAAADALQVRLNLSVKGGSEAESWGPACHLTAFGPNQKGRAVKVLAAVNGIIDWRSRAYKRGEYAPSPADPLIVVIIDEADSAMETPAVRKQVDDIATKGREYGVTLIHVGQRGTADYSSAKTRSQDDVIVIGKVSRPGEVYHAAGSMGFELPDMASYGEGHAGVWVIAELGGGHRKGRAWVLGDTPAGHARVVAGIAEERAFSQPELHPACREFLGESYELLLSTDVFAKWARGQAEHDGAPDADEVKDGTGSPLAAIALAVRDGHVQVAEPATKEALLEGLRIAEDQALRELDFDMEIDDDTRAKLAAIDAKNNATRQMITDTRAMPKPPEVSPEALAASTAERWRQVGDQAQVPDEARPVLLGLLREGTTASAVAEAIGVSKWIARTYLERLRNEGVAYVDGVKRAARWRLAGPGRGDAS